MPGVKFFKRQRLYLKNGNVIHPFCWIEFLEDGSFSIGLLTKVIKITEFGSAIQQQGFFDNHVQTLRQGKSNIDDIADPHYTFHPPKINQNRGLVHIVGVNGKVDEWELDWFPVTKMINILKLYSGTIDLLGTVKKTKKTIQ